MPDLARRGRITIRHFAGLLLGGFIAHVEARRRRGARGLLHGVQRFGAWWCRRLVAKEYADQPFPVQLRRRLETLGPTYIKLGQMLSLRSDLLPEIVTRELGNLLSTLPPTPFGEIRSIIEQDLGRPLDRVFSQVDEEPIGSASIAQTHRATTLEGDRVILKVVKPGIRDLLDRDASLIRGFAALLQVLLPRYQPRRVMDEFFEYTRREVHMTWEADNAESFAANFADAPDIVFPRVYRSHCGESVMCMEFLDGAQPDRERVLALPLAERQRLIDLGAEAILRMLYDDGFFHADLHPGNLLVLEGSRIGFIDLGMVGRLDHQLRRSLLFHFYSVIMEDFENAARHLSEVARVEADSDVIGFRRAVKDVCRRWRQSASFTGFSLGLLVLESLRLGARYRMYFPMEMVLLVKALVTYEGVGYLLDPEFNVAEVSQRHVSRIMRLHFSPVRLVRYGMRAAPDMIEAMFRLPRLVSESLRVLERQARQPRDRPLTGIRASIFGGFCLVSGAVLASFEGPWPVWLALLVLGVVVSLRRG
jgi:ubiquinone biosynthesis protein